MNVKRGTSRSVVLVRRWAIKVPWGLTRRPLRGWLANQSEWRQRHRPDVCAPLLTVGHVVLVMPRAERTGADEASDGYVWGDGHQLFAVPEPEANCDEYKPCSWGRFGDRWLLIDYDRSWESAERGFIGRIYWGKQERLARKWMNL